MPLEGELVPFRILQRILFSGAGGPNVPRGTLDRLRGLRTLRRRGAGPSSALAPNVILEPLSHCSTWNNLSLIANMQLAELTTSGGKPAAHRYRLPEWPLAPGPRIAQQEPNS